MHYVYTMGDSTERKPEAIVLAWKGKEQGVGSPVSREEKAPGPYGSQSDSGRPLIVLRDLTKVYQEGERLHPVLQQVNLSIHPGEFTVLLGRSGSGKSTLLNVLSGIDLPTSGEIVFSTEQGEVHLTRLSERERTVFRRVHIGFIFQFFNLIPTLSVEENLLLPLELNSRAGLAARGRVYDLLDAVGLEDRARSFPDRLSGGEQQRVAIARALVHDPLLLLADEPTGNLDLETGQRVLELLDRLTRQRGKTLIMVTHSPEVIGVADRLLTLHAGQVVVRDHPAEAAG